MISTVEVQDRDCSEEDLEMIKKYLAGRAGVLHNLARERLPDLEQGNKRKVNEGPVFWELFP